MTTDLTRRNFLKSLVIGGGVLTMPALAKMAKNPLHAKELELYNLHTGEKLKTTYWENGEYDTRALAEINHHLRDFRQNEVIDIDKKVIDLLFQVKHQLGTNKGVHILSGYRSPKTNEMLRKKGRKVATRSQHLVGKAIDFYLPGVKLADIRKAAMAGKVGGVGYYPKSHFVHIDSGRVRYW